MTVAGNGRAPSQAARQAMAAIVLAGCGSGGTDPRRTGYEAMAQDSETGSSRRLEDQIRERAYRLWEEEGRPEGRAEIHWTKARALIEGERSQSAAAEEAEEGGARDRPEESLDEQLKESFPASDAPSYTPGNVGGPDRPPPKRRRKRSDPN
jgi:hypothetical protein